MSITDLQISRRLLLAAGAMVGAGLAMPATAQQSSSTHRYATFFKYSDQAVKAMVDNPQDRAAPVVKLNEAFGAKLESIYWFPMGGEFDGIVIGQAPSDAVIEALVMVVRSGGNFTRLQTIPLITADEFKAVMERAKEGSTTYSAPTATRQ
jgi:uncharacterized protein with GYD domain